MWAAAFFEEAYTGKVRLVAYQVSVWCRLCSNSLLDVTGLLLLQQFPFFSVLLSMVGRS